MLLFILAERIEKGWEGTNLGKALRRHFGKVHAHVDPLLKLGIHGFFMHDKVLKCLKEILVKKLT